MMSSAIVSYGRRVARQWPPVRRPKRSMGGGKTEITLPSPRFLPEPELTGVSQRIRMGADSRGRRFHLFRGSRAKRMGGMVVAIFANNLPHVFNIRKPIMVRAEKKIYICIFSIHEEKTCNKIQYIFKI